jgi:hypothetical protein
MTPRRWASSYTNIFIFFLPRRISRIPFWAICSSEWVWAGELRLRVCIANLRDSLAYPGEGKRKADFLSNSSLYQVRGRLAKDVEAPHAQAVLVSRLNYLPAASAELTSLVASPAPRRPMDARDPDVIAFTCGHVFQKRCFYEDVLPMFRQRVASLTPRVPVTMKLLQVGLVVIFIPLVNSHLFQSSLII